MAEEERSSADLVENRLEFETLISDLSSRFINLPPDEVDHAIEEAQRRVCECLDLDLSALWQWLAEGPPALKMTHVYRSLEGPPIPVGTMDAQESFPWCLDQLIAGRIIAVTDVEKVPPEAAHDQEGWRHFNLKSVLTIPLSAGGGPAIGALNFNSIRKQRDWPDALVNRLQLVAQIFASALARKHADEALRDSEERLSLAADSAAAGLWTLDYSTGVFWVTERARTIFGFSADEVITMERLRASVHPDDWDLVRGAVERSARDGEPVNVEYRIVLPSDGAVRWIASNGRPQPGPTGEPKRLTGISIDVTERKHAEQAFRATEARLAAGAALAGLAFYEVDFDQRVAFVDDRFREICGLPPDRQQGLQPLEFWIEHLHSDDRERVLYERQQLHEGRLERLNFEYRFLNPIHGERWIHHVGCVTTRDAAGHTVRSYGVLRDITEHKRAEDALRDLSRRLIRAQEEERALLARELHDDVTQRVAVLAIEAGRAELAATEGSQKQAMRSVREGLVRLSEDIHSLAYQLHPSVLDELGLAEALRAECERVCGQGRVDLSLELDPLSASVGRDAALCLFRLAQEALNNVTRHAGARAASVTLRQMDGGLLLAVRDDGVGFDPVSPGTRRSLGLASMRERVRLVNGTLDIESAPGRGTEIIAWVPVEGEAR
jgi:PAS domain S-box-containing protein